MKNLKFAIVVSRFNQGVTQKLLEGAVRSFKQSRVPESGLKVVWVPGAFEIPLAAQRLAKTKKFCGIVCLGCVLKGETDHNRYLSQACADGIMRVMLETGVPVVFGVLTPNTMKQARARAEKNSANKGSEAALAAIEMAHGN